VFCRKMGTAEKRLELGDLLEIRWRQEDCFNSLLQTGEANATLMRC
jgi:hypothetical protein